MSDNVSWPKASEGGRVFGKEEIRAYWTRQWQEFDPHVEPLDVIDRGLGRNPLCGVLWALAALKEDCGPARHRWPSSRR